MYVSYLLPNRYTWRYGEGGLRGDGLDLHLEWRFLGRCLVSFVDEVFSVWLGLRKIKRSWESCRDQDRLLVELLMVYVTWKARETDLDSSY